MKAISARPAIAGWKMTARWAAGVLATVLAVTACGEGRTPTAGSTPQSPDITQTSAPAGVTHSAANAVCMPSRLTIRLTHSGAVAMRAGAYIQFKNDGPGECRLDGWPAVVAQSVTGRLVKAVPVRATMIGGWVDSSAQPPTVELRVGASAYSVVEAGDSPMAPATSCPSPYRTLRINPPGDSASVVISAWLSTYKHYLPACSSVNVSAVVPLSQLAH
jgi:hypothetical protein